MPEAHTVSDREWIICDKMLNKKGLSLVEF